MNKTYCTIPEAVYAACEEVGGMGGLKAFMKVVNCYYRWELTDTSYNYVSKHRAIWRRKNGNYATASTYEGQPARSMNNSDPSLSQMLRMHKLMSAGVTPNDLREFIGDTDDLHRFHDIAQVERCIEAITKLQVVSEAAAQAA